MSVSDPQGPQPSDGLTAARHESEALFRSIFEHAAMGIERVAVDGRLLLVNAALCRMLGYSECELLKKTCGEITYPEDRERETPLLEAMLRGERESYEIEKRYLHRDGSAVWVHLTSSPVNGADGRPLYRISIIQNITGRKQAESVLQTTLQRFYLILSNMYSGVLLVNGEGRVEFANQAFCDQFGLQESPSGLAGLDPTAVLHKIENAYRYPEQARIRIRRILDRGEAVNGEEVAMQGGRTLLRDFVPLAVDGKSYGRLWLHTDITESKRVEQQLHRLNLALKARSDSSQAVLHATDESVYLKEVCRIVTEDCGHAMMWVGFAENDKEKTVRPVAYAGFDRAYVEALRFTWDDSELGRGPTGTAIRTGQPSMCRDMLTDPGFLPWRKAAVERGYRSSLVVPLMEENRAFGAFSVYSRERDAFSDAEVTLLTELAADLSFGIRTLRLRAAHARAEEALRESERRFRLALKNAPVAVAVQDRDLVYRWAHNPRTRRSDEIIGKTDVDLIAPEDLPKILETKRKVLETGVAVNVQHWLTSNGRRVFLDLYYEPTRDSAGEITGIGIAAVDLTKQTLAEEALRQSEERLRLAIGATSAMVHDFDMSTGRANVVNGLHELLGYEQSEAEPTLEWWNQQIHSEDTAVLQESFRRLQNGMPGHSIQYRIRHKDGRMLWVEHSATPVHDPAAILVRLVGTVIDITERKQAEEAVLASETRYRELAESIPALLWATDAQGVTTDHNRRWHEYTGVPPGQEDRDRWMEFVSPGDLRRVSERWQYSLRTGEDYSIEYRLRRASDGAYRWHAVQAKLRRDEQGNPLGWFGTYIDIEDRKRAEQEREMTIEFLGLVNQSRGTRDLIQRATTFFQKCSGCEAVGIRLREGDDFPYFEARGFSKEFVLLENNLCAWDSSGEMVRDSHGDPVLECMCGNVICGRFDPSEPFFTVQGSFWSNSTSEMLAGTTDANRQSRTRNRCNGEGYESVALLPLHDGNERFGMLQLNDRQKGRFSAEVIALWERLAGYLATALSKFRAEEALHNSERQYRAIGELIDYGVWVCGPDGKNTYASESFLKLVGMTQQECSEFGWGRVLHPDDAERTIAAWKECVQTGGKWDIEHRFLGADGQWHPILARGVPIYNDQGQIACWAGINLDISNLKQAEQALLRSEKLASVGRMAATIAHEINNPLGAVTNVLFLLNGIQGLPETARHYLEIADAELKRVAHITRQSLGFYRESNAPVSTSVNEVLKSTVDLLKGKIRAKRAVIDMQWNEDVQITAVGGELRQVFSNLLANSLDAIDERGVIKVRVSTGSSTKNGHRFVRVTIADNGSGISANLRQQIFEPFVTTKGATGTGLGLWVSKQIIDKHNGVIRMRSNTGGTRRGTVFSVTFPEKCAAQASQSAGS